jgi:hypothetical protein
MPLSMPHVVETVQELLGRKVDIAAVDKYGAVG